MNSVKFKELTTCSKCFELFNEGGQCPRMLACGHTFCQSCLEKILNDLRLCPTCETQIKVLDVESIPLNMIVKSFISVDFEEHPSEVSNNSPEEVKEVKTSNSSKLESRGFCEEHSNNKELRCMECETWICGICSNLNHKNCRTLLVKDAYEELKDQVVQKIAKELDSSQWVNHNLDTTLKACNKRKIDLLKVIKTMQVDVENCNKIFQALNSLKSEGLKYFESFTQLKTAVKNSETEVEFSQTKTDFEDLLDERRKFLILLKGINLLLPSSFPATFEELKTLCAKEPVYLVQNENLLLYGLVTVKGDQIWISSFRWVRPKGILLPMKEFFLKFSGSYELPNRTFLKLRAPGNKVDLVIDTDGSSKGAIDFISRCSGLERYKYIGADLTYHDSSYIEYITGINYVMKNKAKISHGSWKEGVVFGAEFYFCIELEEFSGYSYPEIGVVVSGLEELKKSKVIGYKIEDCGVVI